MRIESTQRSRVFFQRDKLDGYETGTEWGGFVRCLADGGWGVAVFNNLEMLEAKIDEATRAARLVGSRAVDPVRLAVAPSIQTEVRAELVEDFRTMPLERKREVIEGYNRLILASSDRIVASQVLYRDVFRTITYVNSQGTYIVQEIPDTTLLVGAAASDGVGNIQQGFEMVGQASGFEIVRGQEEKARVAAERAVAMLDARSASPGQHTVILDPQLAGVLHSRSVRALLRGGLLVQESATGGDHDVGLLVRSRNTERDRRGIHRGGRAATSRTTTRVCGAFRRR